MENLGQIADRNAEPYETARSSDTAAARSVSLKLAKPHVAVANSTDSEHRGASKVAATSGVVEATGR